ncbi:hypothetical protein T265_03077 [Opisthorchis viverrini]|uniref:Uncharacterized protein n=1 Tax=Opisthorchis viverrini TaxID=6198 RepID=A0A074ZTL9_OPIVI|nr:hypothetical protein T265_03077 [Opisthorchis viverrini]KER30466.1 hypothetical protein T265_03077 [Opisthorchis viverrini]
MTIKGNLEQIWDGNREVSIKMLSMHSTKIAAKRFNEVVGRKLPEGIAELLRNVTSLSDLSLVAFIHSGELTPADKIDIPVKYSFLSE